MSKVIISFSGGIDSTAAVIETMKRYPKKDCELVYEDTGGEYAGTVEFVQEMAGLFELPLSIIRYQRDWYEQIEHDNMPFTPALRKCTHRLKLDVFNSWLSKNKITGSEVVLVTGIRAEESQSRSRLPEEDIDDKNRRIWRPVLYRSKEEAKEMVKAEGLPIHYCYEFSSRCNCAWCVFAGKYEMQAYAELHPEDYEKACLLEEKIDKHLIQHGWINDLMKQSRMI